MDVRFPLAAAIGLALSGFALWSLHGVEVAEGQPSPPLNVIRPACTDNVCGGCDGLCHDPAGVENDHVTVRKNGHCTCTPRPGGALDRALREAYERWTRDVGRR